MIDRWTGRGDDDFVFFLPLPVTCRQVQSWF